VALINLSLFKARLTVIILDNTYYIQLKPSQ
jgi:hypothetical protein